jgi:hypothetical protein
MTPDDPNPMPASWIAFAMNEFSHAFTMTLAKRIKSFSAAPGTKILNESQMHWQNYDKAGLQRN